VGALCNDGLRLSTSLTKKYLIVLAFPTKSYFIEAMAKLVALSKLVAEVTGLSPARVRVLEMVLRKAGMITSGGRGLHAAEMKPSDATNMVLGALHLGAATEVDAGVRELRALEFDFLEVDNPEFDLLNRRVSPFEADIHLPSFIPVPANLGEALDWVFSSPEHFSGPYSDLELMQSGWRTEVTVSICDLKWYDGCHFSNDAKRWALGFASFADPDSRYTSRRTTRFTNPGLQDIARLIAGQPLAWESV
jgi:hypothetical protein